MLIGLFLSLPFLVLIGVGAYTYYQNHCDRKKLKEWADKWGD